MFLCGSASASVACFAHLLAARSLLPKTYRITPVGNPMQLMHASSTFALRIPKEVYSGSPTLGRTVATTPRTAEFAEIVDADIVG